MCVCVCFYGNRLSGLKAQIFHRYYDNQNPGVWGLGLGVEGLGWVYGLGFRVLFLGFGVQGWGFISELLLHRGLRVSVYLYIKP